MPKLIFKWMFKAKAHKYFKYKAWKKSTLVRAMGSLTKNRTMMNIGKPIKEYLKHRKYSNKIDLQVWIVMHLTKNCFRRRDLLRSLKLTLITGITDYKIRNQWNIVKTINRIQTSTTCSLRQMLKQRKEAQWRTGRAESIWFKGEKRRIKKPFKTYFTKLYQMKTRTGSQNCIVSTRATLSIRNHSTLIMDLPTRKCTLGHTHQSIFQGTKKRYWWKSWLKTNRPAEPRGVNF